MKNIKIVIPMITVMTLAACGEERSNQPESATHSATENTVPKKEVELTKVQATQSKQAVKAKEQFMTVTGTMQFMSFEGGFYGIVTDEGQKLLPLNLKPEFRQDGMKLKVTGKIETDIMTTKQWGTPFVIESLEVLAEGKKGGNNEM